MKKFFPIITSAFLFLPSIYSQSTQFPINPPQNEIKGGYFQNYFRNISGLCSSGQAIYGFIYNENNFLDTNNMKKLCYFPRASSFTGGLSGEDYRIPMWKNNGTELGATIMKQKNESKNAAGATIFIGNTNNHNHDAQLSVGTDASKRTGGILITSGSGSRSFVDFAEKDTTTTDPKRPNINLKASIFWDGKDEQFYINAFQNAKNTIVNPSNGNVGIGTKNPTSKLHINNESKHTIFQISSPFNKDSTIWLYSHTGSNAKNGWAIGKGGEYEGTRGNLFINYDDREGVAQKNVLMIRPTGEMGIGIQEPREKLEVDGNISVGALLDGRANREEYGKHLIFAGAKTNSDPLYMYRYNKQNDASELRMVIGDNDGEDSFRIGKVVAPNGFVSSFQPRFMFQSSGKLGIKKDPLYDLDVNGQIASIPTTGHGEIILGTPGDYVASNGTAIGNTQHRIFGPYNSPAGIQGALYIGAGRNGSNREKNEIILYNYGCDGPDRNNPGLNKDCNAKGIRLLADKTMVGKDMDIWGNLRVGFGENNNASSNGRAIEANGWIIGRSGYGQKVYIGGDSAGEDMEIGVLDGNYDKIAFYNRANSTYLSIRANDIWSAGNIRTDGSITAQSFLYKSDKRLKDNIVSLKKMMDLVKRLNPVSFIWKDSSKKSIGFIAQEVEKIFPELVHTDENGYKSVEYANIVAILVAAFQEQDEKILELEKEIVTQNEKIKELEEKMNKILQKK